MTTQAEQLIARWFGQADGELLIGGRKVGELAAEFGTPSFLYDRHVLERKWARLRAGLPETVALYYSLKANPNPAIVRWMVERGAGLEIASAGELRRALEAGGTPQRIAFAGPGKTDAELELAVARGVGEIHVESLREAERLAVIAHRRGARVTVAVRVNPGPGASGGALRMGGKPAPFGIDEETLPEVVARLAAEPSLALSGIHLYVGTQILDHQTLLAQYEHAIDIARRVAAWSGRPLATVDLGGGLGVPYFANEVELDVDELGRALVALLNGLSGDAAFAGTRFVLEPGRYLVAEAGVYVARVVDTKTSRGKRFVVLDGGMNHHLAASGNLGQVLKRNFPIAVLNKLGRSDGETVDVVGPLCTPLDALGRDVRLPAVEVGDLVGIFQSGAYALSASPQEFLSRPSPAEVLIADGRATIIRPRAPRDDP
jgi:diaminopimelate decarboxylase